MLSTKWRGCFSLFAKYAWSGRGFVLGVHLFRLVYRSVSIVASIILFTTPVCISSTLDKPDFYGTDPNEVAAVAVFWQTLSRVRRGSRDISVVPAFFSLPLLLCVLN